MKKNRNSFTLAELLIVVVIIAVLVAISIPIFSSQLEKSRRAVDVSNARNIESTVLTYWMDGELKLDDNQACNVYVARYKPSEFKVTPVFMRNSGVLYLRIMLLISPLTAFSSIFYSDP